MTFRILLFALALPLSAREVAITIDDLPRGGDGPCDAAEVKRITARLIEPFRREKIPVIGFVNAGRCREKFQPDDLREVLAMWLEAGADLGNHTFSHPSLNTTLLAEYQDDILRGEPILKDLLAARERKLRYFRHPFLHAGPALETRRALEQWLQMHDYTVAPVTLDNSDWMFAEVYGRAKRSGNAEIARRAREAYLPYMESIFDFFEKRSVEVAGHEVRQILLIHANELNSEVMPKMLELMKKRGYRFISLERALEDPAYKLPDEYAGTGGFSWIHRWSKTKGMRPKGEPDEPAFIAEEYQRGRK
ncbi:MAG: polysaccharide deacetylase family protein [Acidobacteria bacterium]|nr:polysaccharide deacetylase family protein [Acidobacteriota bacterium]